MGAKNAPPQHRILWAGRGETAAEQQRKRVGSERFQASDAACVITMIVTQETQKRRKPCIARISVTTCIENLPDFDNSEMLA